MIFVGNRVKTFSIVLAGLILANSTSMSASTSTTSDTQPVLYEVQTGGTSSAAQELIVLFNNSQSTVDVSNWCIEYASATGSTKTQIGCLKTASESVRLMLPSFGFVLASTTEFKVAHPETDTSFTFTAGLSSIGGHIRLLDSSKQVIDVIGYGTATAPETSPSVAPSAGKVIKRIKPDGRYYQDTNNNQADFEQGDVYIMGSGLYEQVVEVDHCNNIDGVQTAAPDNYSVNDGQCSQNYQENRLIEITELLPNPAGADTGKEYIEFYNPNDTEISLKDYVLQLGPSYTKQVVLPDINIEPHSYVVLNDIQSGLALTNTSGGLRLLATNGDIVSEVPLYNQLADDVVWVLLNNEWQVSYLQTPGAPNAVVSQKPCAPGLLRVTPDSICKKPVNQINPSASVSCPVGQIRNPETKRCRKLEVISTAKPCEPGQVRNTITGRCKKAIEATTKACPTGQEKNPDTGRCRKSITKSSDIAKVKDVSSPFIENSAKWWAAGVAGSGSVGYAAYEWRLELRRRLEMLLSKLRNLRN